ncbi:hypothetical protein MPTK2_1g11420 [Marchantia polymorpha subsp. ruderalis]
MSAARARALQAALRPITTAAAAPVAKAQSGEAILRSSDSRLSVRELHSKNSRCFHGGESTRNKGLPRKLAAARSEYTEADQAATAPWPIVRRSVLETLLKNYARYPIVVQPLILHGPRGVGKRTVVEELMKEWRKPPHVVAFVNLSGREICPWFESDILEDNQNTSKIREGDQKPKPEGSLNIGTIRYMVEEGLEYLASKAVEKGYLTGDDVLAVLMKHYAVDGALSQFLRTHGKKPASVETITKSGNTRDMWKEGIEQMRKQFFSEFVTGPVSNHPGSTETQIQQSDESGLLMSKKPRSQVLVREEAILSLALAQQLLKIHENWKIPSKQQLKSEGIVSKAPADAATSYSILLLRLISGSVREGTFQPKLIINNLGLMRKAAPENPEDGLHGALYHDSLLMQITKLGFSEGCIPIISVSSDSYYSRKLFEDHGNDHAFISQETLGWTPKEAAIHLVPTIFEEPEWKVINTVLGSNVRHLKELHSIWHHPSFWELLEENSGNAIEDCIDLYLGYLQVTAIDPSMEAASKLLETFAQDVAAGKISRSRLKHGVPWRHPPRTPQYQRRWARLQLLDYIQALADTDFAVNHQEEKAQEFLDDPSTDALLQVGLLYKQREPPYLRPITRGVARCLVRWYVKERLQLTMAEDVMYKWHRFVRGRYYRQLIVI